MNRRNREIVFKLDNETDKQKQEEDKNRIKHNQRKTDT